MSYTPSYAKGQWLTICDQCGRQYKSSELRMRWDNLMVCETDWEPRQPQDFVRGVADTIAPPWTRPESSNFFILPNSFFSTLTSKTNISMSITVLRTSKQEINGAVLNNFTLG